MSKNKKIFYGVLIVVILALGGVIIFVLTRPPISSLIPLPPITFEENCDKLKEQIDNLIEGANYCDEDSDCVVSSPKPFICNFGCYFLLNKNVDTAPINENIAKYRANKDCHPFLLCKCPAMPAADKIQCANNKCIDVREITITTDKTEYEQGENITITIENNLGIPAELRCCPLINFERKENDKWAPLKQWEGCPCGSPKCLLAPSWSIEAKQKRIEKWDQKLILGCEGLKTVSQEASPGKYRATTALLKNKGFGETIYSNEFTIKEKEATIPQDKETCEAQGGKWGRFGLKPPEAKEECNLPTSDAGKECYGSNECEGSCIADIAEFTQKQRLNKTDEPVYIKGKCTAWRMVFGCHPFVENGKAEGILCAD